MNVDNTKLFIELYFFLWLLFLLTLLAFALDLLFSYFLLFFSTLFFLLYYAGIFIIDLLKKKWISFFQKLLAIRRVLLAERAVLWRQFAF